MSSLIQRSALFFCVMNLASAVQASPTSQAKVDWQMRVVAHCSSQPSKTQLEDIQAYVGKLTKTVQRNWFPPKDGDPCMVKFVIESTGVSKDFTVTKHAGRFSEYAALRAVDKATRYFPALESPLRSFEVEFPFTFSPPVATLSIVIDKPAQTQKPQN
ncbi:MAG: hypothetical protein JST89_03520 [Cyanobacteria bacterium SZAS-4]|nr:hypothetical protein [Cyanobacteria bacterium SZAS-4]